MIRKDQDQLAEGLELAAELRRLARGYRVHLFRTHYYDTWDLRLAIDRLYALDLRVLDLENVLAHAGVTAPRDSGFMLGPHGESPDLARALDGLAVQLRREYEGKHAVQIWKSRPEGRLLACLACFLPADKRSRFVDEGLGNLGDCEHWWQRLDPLVCLAIATPRLAWMMRREGRRRPA